MNRLVSFASKFLVRQCPKTLPKNPHRFVNPHIRSLHSCRTRNQMPKTPELIYMPHIFRWIKSKLSFTYLRKMWDPEFSEGAFIYGSTRAVCRITEIISSGKVDQLKDLMTVPAKMKLEDDMHYRLTSAQKRLIKLKPEDIKILIPVTVTFNRDGPRMFCKVNLRVLALKWHEVSNDNYKLVLVALQTEFSRDYAEDASPDWNISAFSILECALLSEATASRSDK